jgi:predicted GIY-YIG superfamily endonuclease
VSFNVYLLIGADDKPIYIGASTNVTKRLAWHRSDKTRYTQIGGLTKAEAMQRVELVTCADRNDMDHSELRLINEHRPVLNEAGKDPMSGPEYDQYVRETVANMPPFSARKIAKLTSLFDDAPSRDDSVPKRGKRSRGVA